MQVSRVDATLGALVTDVELRSLDDTAINNILDAWHECGVLVFPDQHLTDDEQIAFSRHFGAFERGLSPESTHKLARITNLTPAGEVAEPTSLQVRFHEGNTDWHSDSSYKNVGAKASILSARQVPAEGGETEWADMRAAWDALDVDTQQSLEDKIAVHSFAYSHSWHGGLEMVGENIRFLPPVEHPVVRVHPATGRKNLFVGRHASHIVGEDELESRLLLQKLTDDGAKAPRLWKHPWRSGDIAIWDNRCVLHRGHLWPLTQPRSMVRTTIAGDDPDNEWAMSA
ncbi:MAG: 2,4-dichlorophenoxyacetate dioxygenase [Gammaproteobacteria bacterium]|nr:2,4-dichlorophenoxyacetate dioxygenase [Gammaproteobacteria bacterium]RPG23967.1 MAG: TauD/TfdA family dioxygenase [Gammaproteobacteria bacterium TMED50]|tara:strand:+ start:3895 stop:4749 length:855 start_codon:yes stop_codon:yes gene_type:complete